MTQDRLIGQQIDEYRIEALLGRGGMARVYRAVDVRLKRYVAIKVIDTPYRSDSAYAARFEREAQAIAQLEHPHIVRLYRYGEAGGSLYMAMQYVDGADLQVVLDSYKASGDFIEPQDALRITGEIADALDAMHARGIIHRDIKPSNIMLNKQGQAILTDFGLALLVEVGTRGEILGSPTHIAPEQAISSAKAVPQSDLYSLGVILYEMFTNLLPFYATEPLDLAMLHLKEPPPPPRTVRPQLSLEVEQVILKALAKQPGERYQTGAELKAALEQALQAAPVASISLPTLPRQSVLQRVEQRMAEQPLPPLPAAVSPPPLPEASIGQRLAEAPPAQPAEKTASSPLPEKPKSLLRGKAGLVGGAAALLACLLLLTLALGLIGLFYRSSQRQPLAAGIAATSSTPNLVSPLLERTPAFTASPASLLPLPSASPLPPSPSPTLAPTSTVEPSPTPLVLTYQFLIATHKDDSLVIVNRSEQALPLAWLRLGQGETALWGAEWGVETLAPGECVIAVKDTGRPKLPKVDCLEVGERLVRGPGERFWTEEFQVYFQEQQVALCSDDGGDKNEKYCLIVVKKTSSGP